MKLTFYYKNIFFIRYNDKIIFMYYLYYNNITYYILIIQIWIIVSKIIELNTINVSSNF